MWPSVRAGHRTSQQRTPQRSFDGGRSATVGAGRRRGFADRTRSGSFGIARRAGLACSGRRALAEVIRVTGAAPIPDEERPCRVGVVRCDGHVAGADRGNPFQRVFEVTDTVPSPLLVT
jgi:hypothetical protein